MRIFLLTGCCGMVELDGISKVTATEAIAAVRKYLEEVTYAPAHILFTQAWSQGATNPTRYGSSLADYIIDNSLGFVVPSDVAVNPKTNNMVQAFVWTPHVPNIHLHR